MARMVVVLLFLLHCLLNSVDGSVCLNQGDQIYCPPPSDSALGYCCGETNLQQCCSYEDSYGISSTDGLSNGAIAGIVIGCLLVCVVLGLLAYLLRRLKMKLDEKVMERRSTQRRSINGGSMNREAPVRGSFKRTSMRTSTRRRDDREPLNTRESQIFTTADGLTNPGFDYDTRKPLGRTEPMQNGKPVHQNGHHHNGYTQSSKADMEIIGLDDSPKMYDRRKQWEDFNDPQLILQLDESPKMNEKWRHPQQTANGVDEAAAMEAKLRYHQLQEQHALEQSRQLNAHYREQLQHSQHQAGAQFQPDGGMQYHQANQHVIRSQQPQPNGHQGMQLQANQQQMVTQLQSNGQNGGMQLQQSQHQMRTQLPSNQQDIQDGTPEPVSPKSKKKKKTPRRNLPPRTRDNPDSKWLMGYTRETMIQLKRNPSSKCNSPTASKDFDPDNPPGILKYRDSEMSDYDSTLDDSDQVFDDQSFERPQSGHFDKLTRRSPSPKQTLAVAPYRQSEFDNNHQPVPMDQILTLDPRHLKPHVASYSPSQLSPSQLSPTGREGRHSYFSPNEDFDNSFAKSYPEFVQNKANQPKDVLPHLHISQKGGRQTPTEIGNGTVNSPKEYVDYNRAGEELRCTSL